MPLPKPVPGLVVRYSYLWAAEHRRGQEEGRKDRPCALVAAVVNEQHEVVVTVFPITHTPPWDLNWAVPIPPETNRRLGLDDRSSWVVVTEANRFVWPGPDLRFAASGQASSVAYGLLPRALFKVIQERFASAVKAGALTFVSRTQ